LINKKFKRNEGLLKADWNLLDKKKHADIASDINRKPRIGHWDDKCCKRRCRSNQRTIEGKWLIIGCDAGFRVWILTFFYPLLGSSNNHSKRHKNFGNKWQTWEWIRRKLTMILHSMNNKSMPNNIQT
jgi:hypothetical protein